MKIRNLTGRTVHLYSPEGKLLTLEPEGLCYIIWGYNFSKRIEVEGTTFESYYKVPRSVVGLPPEEPNVWNLVPMDVAQVVQRGDLCYLDQDLTKNLGGIVVSTQFIRR